MPLPGLEMNLKSGSRSCRNHLTSSIATHTPMHRYTCPQFQSAHHPEDAARIFIRGEIGCANFQNTTTGAPRPKHAGLVIPIQQNQFPPKNTY